MDAASRASASPSGSGRYSTVPDSDVTEIDSLLAGTKWGGGVGTGATVTYSFPGYGAAWAQVYSVDDEPGNGFTPLSGVQEDAVRSALHAWSGLANLNLVEVADTGGSVGDIRFGESAAVPTAQSYWPGGDASSGDVWLGPDLAPDASYAPGTYEYDTLMHEIGHALGLKHPFEGNGSGVVMPAAEDWLGTSVMSYRSSMGGSVSGGYSIDFYPTTPMGYDVKAIQYLYGADPSIHDGNTTYSWSPGQQILETIVDSSGRDTIDWSSQTSAAMIDLAPGSWSDLGPAYGFKGGHYATTLFIAAGTVIENAIGGSGKDVIHGNDAANCIGGGAGNDKLYGGNGDDTLAPGPGNDKVYGDAGKDTVVFHGDLSAFAVSTKKSFVQVAETDHARGGEGKDKIYAAEILQFDDASIGIGTGAHGRPVLLGAMAAAPQTDLDHLVARDTHVA
jgi:serralysin